jgi:hypothetical protein
MPTLLEFVMVLAFSAVASAVVELLGRRLPSAVRLSFAMILGITAGHVGYQWCSDLELARVLGEPSSSAVTRTWVSFTQPTEARLWLPALLLAGLVPAGVISLLTPGRRPARPGDEVPKPSLRLIPSLVSALVALLAFAGLQLRVLWGSVYLLSEWSTTNAAVIIAGIAIVATFMATFGQLSTSRRYVSLQLLLTAALFGTSGLVFLMSGSKTIGMLTLSGLGATFALSVLTRLPSGDQAACFPAFATVLGFGSHLALAYFYSELTNVNTAFLILSLALIVSLPRFPKTWTWRARVAVPTMFTGALLASAITNAGMEFRKATQQQEADPYAEIYQ